MISFVSKEYISFVLNIYFFFIGIVALFRAIKPLVERIQLPAVNQLRERLFYVTLVEGKRSATPGICSTHLELEFDLVDVGTFLLCVLVGVWYLIKRHWIANNIFGIAFAINAIEILHFNK